VIMSHSSGRGHAARIRTQFFLDLRDHSRI
jgi:hypothetical protein